MDTETCILCKRNIHTKNMTIHHWNPKCEGGTLEETMRICKTCHLVLHYVIPIDQVKYFKTPEKLENHWLFGSYLNWIREKAHSSMYKIKKTLKFWFPKRTRKAS